MGNILLIEDDPFLIDIYATKLKEAGFSVEVAINGEQGLKKLFEKRFELLLLDIVLPQVDGWEILEKIKNQKSLKQNKLAAEPAKIKNLEDLKIIVLSNLGQKNEVEKGIIMGATKYLIKAYYTPSEVVEEIREVLK